MLQSFRRFIASYLVRLGLKLLPFNCPHANHELDIVQENMLIPEADKIARLVLTHLKLHELFSKSKKNDAIVGYLIFRLLNGYPLSELTGFEDEWENLTTRRGNILVNKRCREVIKSPSTSTSWFMRAQLFEQEDGRFIQTFRSTKVIQFPYNIPDHPKVIKFK